MTELEIVQQAVEELKPDGRASAEYITAEFAPFSDQFRPDLVLRPRLRPNDAFMVEFRLATSTICRCLAADLAAQLAEHRDFVELGEGVALHFAFASNRPYEALLENELGKRSIAYFSSIDSAQALAEEIRRWVSATPSLGDPP